MFPSLPSLPARVQPRRRARPQRQTVNRSSELVFREDTEKGEPVAATNAPLPAVIA